MITGLALQSLGLSPSPCTASPSFFFLPPFSALLPFPPFLRASVIPRRFPLLSHRFPGSIRSDFLRRSEIYFMNDKRADGIPRSTCIVSIIFYGRRSIPGIDSSHPRSLWSFRFSRVEYSNRPNCKAKTKTVVGRLHLPAYRRPLRPEVPLDNNFDR